MNVEEIKKDNRPRGKGSKGPYRMTEPDVSIPEFINLPDGRKIKTADILGKRNGSRVYNLLDPASMKAKVVRKVPVTRTHTAPNGNKTKYSTEERLWQTTASVHEIAEKYNMNLKTASTTRLYARKLLESLKVETDTGYIIDHTKNVSK